MSGSIGDWFADRQDGSLGDSPDDEVVEYTAFSELPPEFPDEPLGTHPSSDEADALSNDLPETHKAPHSERPPADARRVAAVPRPSAEQAVTWQLRRRILDAARLRRGATAKEIAADVRLRGADVTTAQVVLVLGTLSAEERLHVHGQQTAVQREARQMPSLLDRPIPPEPARPQPPPRQVPQPTPKPEVCPACGVRVRERGLCGCS